MSEPDKETQLLAAAAEVFRSPDYDVFSDVQYKEIAERSGWSIGAVQKAFTKPELRAKLIDYMTAPEEAKGRVGSDLIAEALKDRSIPLVDALYAIGEYHLRFNLTDEMLRSTMALWPYAKHVDEEGGSEKIRDNLIGIYNAFDEEVEAALNNWLVDHSDIVRPRNDYMTVNDFCKLVIAMTEGISLRYSLDQDDVDIGLVAKGYAACMAAMLHFNSDEEPEPGSPPAAITRLDNERRQ